MKTKPILIIFATAILTWTWCSTVWADRSKIRDQRQTRRIVNGIRNGEITRPEARRLKNEQRRIDGAYHRALADGHVNWRERQRLGKMQDRASRHIYRAKHNDANRRLNGYYHKGASRKFHHRHVVVHNRYVNDYYPVPDPGYAFSVGLSDIGWQFAFSGWGR